MLLLTTNSIFQRLAVWHLSHFQFILQPWLQKRRGRGQRLVVEAKDMYFIELLRCKMARVGGGGPS